MLYDGPHDPESAEVVDSSTMFLSYGNPSTIRLFPREIPDPSKHSVSPSALTAALERYNEEVTPYTQLETAIEQTLRKYKRAKFAETKAGLPCAHDLFKSGPANEHHKEPDLGTVSDEDSYWKSAFGNNEMRTSTVVTEGTSQSARRLLFEYGRRSNRTEQKSTLSSPALSANATTKLPHRLRNPDAKPDTSVPADTMSDDEGFAMVHRPNATARASLHSPMSSPELVPAASIAQTIGDDQNASDDDWTML
jgi:hypothetical protein